MHTCFSTLFLFKQADARFSLPDVLPKQAGAKGLLQAFRSPVFDTSMSRNPSAVLATDFFAGDRHAAAAASVSTTSSSSSPNVNTDLEADDNSAAAAGDEGRQRRRLSRTEEGFCFFICFSPQLLFCFV